MKLCGGKSLFGGVSKAEKLGYRGSKIVFWGMNSTSQIDSAGGLFVFLKIVNTKQFCFIFYPDHALESQLDEVFNEKAMKRHIEGSNFWNLV